MKKKIYAIAVTIAMAVMNAITASAAIADNVGTSRPDSKERLTINRPVKHIDMSRTKSQLIKPMEETQPQLSGKYRGLLSDRKREANNPATAINKAPGKTYSVTCKYESDDRPTFTIINNDSSFESEWTYEENENPHEYIFSVPAGTYDVVMEYWMPNSVIALMVKENIVVDSDMEIVFKEEELTEYMKFTPTLRDGSPVIMPLTIRLDEEPWVEYDYTDANALGVYCSYSILRPGGYHIADGMMAADNRRESEVFGISYMTNKLPSDYHVVFSTAIKVSEDVLEVSVTDLTDLRGSDLVNVLPTIRFPFPAFSHSPLYEELGTEKYNTVVNGVYWIDDFACGGGGWYMASENPEVYFGQTPQTTDKMDVKGVVKSTQVDAEKTVHVVWDMGDGETFEFDELMSYENVALPAIYVDGRWEYVNQNHSECGDWSYQRPKEGSALEYPGHEEYSFYAEEQTGLMGNSTPILVLMTQVLGQDNGYFWLMEPNAYIGRYGEVRISDQATLDKKMYIDGVLKYNSEDGGDMNKWCWNNSFDGHEKGVLEGVFTNRNVKVDNIYGYNISRIKVDERNADLCAPNLQMLIFKDTEGNINDRFENPEDGIIEFSAGDFNWVEEPDNWYYECEMPEVVKVEYAPFRETSYKEIAVEEVPELYYMPGFGHFFRGSLGCVDQPSSNGWYDLRFTLVDKAGNEMVQELSPAFKIDSLTSGISMVKNDLPGVHVNGRDIEAPENASIFSVSGVSVDGHNLCPGIYFVTLNGNTQKVLIK